MEEKNELLFRQKNEVEQAQTDLQKKAEELALASKYKSEFLANMSHELRTPLNSLLLLAQVLAENKEGNLDEEQVELAQIIHSSGNDLLNLINEILDLAKIEAGRIELKLTPVKIEDLAEGVRAAFTHMAERKKLDLKVEVEPGTPAEMISDRKRLDQILKNLVSNAIKFTESGQVRVAFHRPRSGVDVVRLGLPDTDCLAISIRDTGIGITPEQHKVVFEAFQQADGSTSRRYGGTGLGLSISRELAHLLDGAIDLESEPDKGSTFTLYLPLKLTREHGNRVVRQVERMEVRPAPTLPKTKAFPDLGTLTGIPDDRDGLTENDRVILVVEDDPKFAKILYGKCHAKGFKCLVAPSGEAGLELAREHLPKAMILDLHLPGLDGWSVLDELKLDTRTRHIPVHIMSVEEPSGETRRRGAVGHATKPLDNEQLEEAFAKLERVASKGPKQVLVVEDDDRLRRKTVNLIGGEDVAVKEVSTGTDALKVLREKDFDCIILDLGLPDMEGRELLETLFREEWSCPR